MAEISNAVALSLSLTSAIDNSSRRLERRDADFSIY